MIKQALPQRMSRRMQAMQLRSRGEENHFADNSSWLVFLHGYTSGVVVLAIPVITITMSNVELVDSFFHSCLWQWEVRECDCLSLSLSL